jgi:hypothetical protein
LHEDLVLRFHDILERAAFEQDHLSDTELGHVIPGYRHPAEHALAYLGKREPREGDRPS